MTSYNTLLSFHKEAENRYYTDCEWTKNKSIQKFKHLPQKRFPFFFYTWQSQSMLYRLFPLSTLLLTYYSSSKNICECHQETLNRAIVSKNSKSSIKTREREREREREKKKKKKKKLQAKSQIDKKRERKNKKQRKKIKKKKQTL
jgi:Na+-transporting NADH:ubiquinone oxidoreductase subunit NqrC